MYLHSTTPNTWLEVSVSDILGSCLFPAYLQWYQRITIESVVLVYEAGWALTLDPSQCTNLSGLDFFPFIVRTQYKLQYECGLVGSEIGYSLVVVSRTSIQLSSDLHLCGCEGSWQVSVWKRPCRAQIKVSLASLLDCAQKSRILVSVLRYGTLSLAISESQSIIIN